MEFITKNFKGYELLDSGEGRKLERICGELVDRPCPQAIWKKKLPESEWKKADSICLRTDDGGGKWVHKKGEKDHLKISFTPPFGSELEFKLKLTNFGHCGLFFEQFPIWQFLSEKVHDLLNAKKNPVKIVNLFAYTGAASLSMARAGGEVFHVDSAKGILNWAKDWGQLNQVSEKNLRLVHEDARAFLKHSLKKGFFYDGILMDPPSWGHGKEKEVWNFDEEIADLTELAQKVLHRENAFLFLTSHTHGVQHEALKNLLRGSFKTLDAGELAVAHKDDERLLPAGIYALGMR